MTRPNKLEGLSLETLSSQVLEFEGKARANPIGAPFLGNLVLPANVRLDWKVIARYKHSSLIGLVISKEKSFLKIDTWGYFQKSHFAKIIFNAFNGNGIWQKCTKNMVLIRKAAGKFIHLNFRRNVGETKEHLLCHSLNAIIFAYNTNLLVK
jgi:hypothetical protein